MPPDANVLKAGVPTTLRDRSNHTLPMATHQHNKGIETCLKHKSIHAAARLLPTVEHCTEMIKPHPSYEAEIGLHSASKKRPRSHTLDSPCFSPSGKENLTYTSSSDSNSDSDNVFFSSSPSSSPRGSILKGRRKKMKGSLSPNTKRALRNVQFRPGVIVFLMNDEGDHVCTKCEHLKEEPEVSSAPRIRSFRTSSQMCNKDSLLPNCQQPRCSTPRIPAVTLTTPDNNVSNAPPTHAQNYVIRYKGVAAVAHTRSDVMSDTPSSNPTPSLPQCNSKESSLNSNGQSCSSSSSSQGLAIGSMNISFFTGATRSTNLKMSIFIGHGYTADDIVVKAGVNGSQVRVIANKFTPHPTGQSQVLQFNEKYALPMSVDPYSIDARVDNHGFLTVEAALMTLDRKEVVSSQG